MDARYDFGRNWSEFAARIDERHLEQAKTNLARLAGDVEDCSFLDIGCGSGLHSAAALALGARTVRAFDYDPDSVATTRAVLQRFVPDMDWTVERADALDSESLPQGPFDVVYSWGVLHHTGDMWKGIENATNLVAPDGRLCLALYLRTPLCGIWEVEKKLYSRNRWLRPVVKWPYIAAFLLRKQMVTHDSVAFVRDYRESRGMEFLTDVDDWLGGYPYESVVPDELKRRLEGLEFSPDAEFNAVAGKGFFGTGCGEWRFRRAG